MATASDSKKESVKEYYSKDVKKTEDLKTSACTVPTTHLPEQQRKILKQIHPEVLSKFYGCGTPIPEVLEGTCVLDLGCGTGRDVYFLSALVGPKGSVIGLDMTDEQLEVAERHKEYHAKEFGHEKSNVRFIKGFIEDLSAIEDSTVDIVVSNCVINLSTDKPAVFKEVYRVLKPGGEIYFSDVYCDRRIPEKLQEDRVLWGECLSGALYWNDFLRQMKKAGFLDTRMLSSSIISTDNEAIRKQLGDITFFSRTVRAFKLDLEDGEEDFGQSAVYQGTIEGYPHAYDLDEDNVFITGRKTRVSGNTARILSRSRYTAHFKGIGCRGAHLGEFGAVAGPKKAKEESSSGGCC